MVQEIRDRYGMFPAPAGMSPTDNVDNNKAENVPRTRGDEPRLAQQRRAREECSPHPRG